MKLHYLIDQGIQNMTAQQAADVERLDNDHAPRDLFRVWNHRDYRCSRTASWCSSACVVVFERVDKDCARRVEAELIKHNSSKM